VIKVSVYDQHSEVYYLIMGARIVKQVSKLGHRLDNLAFESCYGQEIFLFYKTSGPTLGVTQPYSVVAGGSFFSIKVARAWG
jgi:hypothetical protein